MGILKEKKAIITGGSTGIGLGITEGFLKEGASVAIVSRSAEINETEKEKTIYTNKDKFEYLSKKNTNLSDLKNKLGLDYEF